VHSAGTDRLLSCAAPRHAERDSGADAERDTDGCPYSAAIAFIVDAVGARTTNAVRPHDVWFARHERWQPSYVERMFETCHRRDHCSTVAPSVGARPRCRISPGVRHDDADAASAPGGCPFRPLRRRAAAHATHPRAARDRRGPAGGLVARSGAPPPRPPARPGPLSARLVPPVRGAELLCSRSGDRRHRTGGRSPAPSGRLSGGRRRRRRSGLEPTITDIERVRSEECAGRTPCRVTTNGGRAAARGQGDTSRVPPRRRHPARPESVPLLAVADSAIRAGRKSGR
jgi:hypothetical protein